MGPTSFAGNDSFGRAAGDLMNQEWGGTTGFGGFTDTTAFDPASYGINPLGGANDVLGGMSAKDKWAAGLGFAGTAFAGAGALKNWQLQDKYMEQMDRDAARKRKEDEDYDKFKASWSGAGGTNASSVGLQGPAQSGTAVGTKTAPPVY